MQVVIVYPVSGVWSSRVAAVQSCAIRLAPNGAVCTAAALGNAHLQQASWSHIYRCTMSTTVQDMQVSATVACGQTARRDDRVPVSRNLTGPSQKFASFQAVLGWLSPVRRDQVCHAKHQLKLAHTCSGDSTVGSRRLVAREVGSGQSGAIGPGPASEEKTLGVIRAARQEDAALCGAGLQRPFSTLMLLLQCQNDC